MKSLQRSCCKVSKRLSSTIAADQTTKIDTEYSNAKPFSAIPGPRKVPVFGNLLSYKIGPYSVSKYHEALLDIKRKYGPLVTESFGSRKMLHVFDPEDARLIFQNEGKMPHIVPLQETAQMYREMRQLSLGLGNMNGEEWYRLKRGVQQAMMRPQSVYAYIPLVEEVAKDFVSHIQQQRAPDGHLADFRNDVAKWSLESSAMLVFEKRLKAFESDSKSNIQKMIDANTEMFHLAGLLKFSLPLFKYIPTPKWRRLVKAEDYFYSEVKNLIEETFSRITSLSDKSQSIGDDQFNFIGYLLSKPELSERDVYIVCLSLFGDGLNTTAPALIYNLYCLSANEIAQEKLYEEIKQNVGQNELTSEVLQNMPYLKACVKEAFRLYPIGTEVSRVIQKNSVLSGYQVPAGTHVEICMLPELINEKYFKNALKFQPERWMRDTKDISTVPRFVLTPFGHGPRMCAGRRFAEQDLYVVLTRLVKNFKIGYTGPPMKQVMKTLLLPEDTKPFTFTDR